jgi:hypothetical protein
MRLYLSSFGFGACLERLSSLVGGDTRVALIMNALDNFPRARHDWSVGQSEELVKLGFASYELDLRQYFQRPGELPRVHYKSEHSESESIDREIAYYEQHNMRYITLRDGEALVIDGDQTETVGHP